MRILASPDGTRTGELRGVYRAIFKEASELYVASAYLTDWSHDERLSRNCQRATFLIGTDFGLTRKAALRALLAWIPRDVSALPLAVPRLENAGFHPKCVLWKTPGEKCFCLVGSSNLSRAAFDSNYEINAFSEVSLKEYERLTEWLEVLCEKAVPISKDWIEHHYVEARVRPSSGGAKDGGHSAESIKLRLPSGKIYEEMVRRRRSKQAKFSEISAPILREARNCSKGELSNANFWRKFWDLWAGHESRFQGSGLQFTCKYANWKHACSSLVNIIDAKGLSTAKLDHLVAREIDDLKEDENPARGAWLSEMLCHYFPEQYPILDHPVRVWLSANNWRGRRGLTEGQRYVELARQLRTALRQRPAGAKNLAELDLVIWQWAETHG